MTSEKCPRCQREVAPEQLVCDFCHGLVHATQLEELAAQAKALENQGELRKAGKQWSAMLPLLPPDSTQAGWVRNHAEELAASADRLEPQTKDHRWARKLGPLGPLAILLAKSKALLAIFKLNFLFSLIAFIGVYWALFGARFGVGFAALILLHEMGHFVDVKRRGLPADMPVFLPGLGAYVRWQALGVSAETRAAVSLAGPAAGWLASAICAVVWWTTGARIWAALAHTGAWLNLLNTIPVWVLDGGQAVRVLGKTQRILLLTTSVTLGLVLGQSVFLLVAAGAAYRLFTKDMPLEPSGKITAYFMVVLVLLGLLMWAVPA